MSDGAKIAALAQNVRELKRKTAFLKSALDAVSANIAILDEAGQIITINQEWRRFAEANGLEWGDHGLGRNYLDVCKSVTGDDAAMAQAAYHGVRAVIDRKRDDFAMEYPCHSPEQKRWFQMRTARFEDMGAGRAVVTHVNITERKLAEEALRTSENRFHSLFEDLPIAVWEEDWTAIKDYLDGLPVTGDKSFKDYLESHPEVVQQCVRLAKIVGVNRSTLEMFAAREGEELFNSLPKLFVSETYDSYKKALVALQEGETQLELETAVKTLADTIKQISLRWSIPSGIHVRPVRALVSMADITKRKKNEQKIFQYQKRLRSLSSKLALLEERERRRIAADLHDNLGQTLAMAKIKLVALGEAVASAAGGELVKEVKTLIEESIHYTRTLTSDVSPPILYHLSFKSSIEWLVENVLEKAGLVVKLEDDGKPKNLDDDARVLLFKAVRELMINVVKHAEAQNVRVSLRREAQRMLIEVDDDGLGFEWKVAENYAESQQKYGLFTIHERITYLGGRLEISPGSPAGTRVLLWVPLKKDDQGH